MINGDPKEFLEGLFYGGEWFYYFRGHTYHIQSYYDEPNCTIKIDCIDGAPGKDPTYWKISTPGNLIPLIEFEQAKIFDGMTFWEAEKEIRWLYYYDEMWTNDEDPETK